MPSRRNPYHAVPNHQRLDKTRDLHHRWWRRGNFRKRAEKAFLGLGCLRDAKLDVLVHGIVHVYGYNEPGKPSSSEMDYFVGRHLEGACGCRNADLLVPVNILYVARDISEAEQMPMPACAFTLWDREVLQLASQLYAPKSAQAANKRQVRRLEARHALKACGCYQDGVLIEKQLRVSQLIAS